MELTLETKYRLLLEISQKVRDTLDLDEILDHILDSVKSVLPYDAAGIFILNRDLFSLQYGPPLHVIAGVARRGFRAQPLLEDPMLAQGKGIIGRVINTGQSKVVPDVRVDPDYVEGRQETLSEIAVPVVLRERVIGAINLESNQLAAFDDNDLEVLCFFADAAAISIEKAVLHRQIVQKELLEKELETACEVQSRLLPVGSPGLAGYDIAGVCLPTEEIGGDYFDFIQLPHNRLGVVVADVSGHGIPAALVMTAFRALLRTTGRSYSKPARVARTINELLPEFTGDRHFVTAFYTILNPQDGRIEYTCCGHQPALLVHPDGQTVKLEQRGPALGVFRHSNFPSGIAQLAPGEIMALYTDGVVETIAADDQHFGLERLAQVLYQGYHLSAEQLISRVVQETRAFSGSNSYTDDFTLVVIKRQG